MNDFLAAGWGMGLAAEPVGELWFSSSEFKSGTYPTQPRQRFDLRVPPPCRAGWGWGSLGNRLGEARRAPIFPPNPDRVSRPRDSGRVRARLEAHTLSGASPVFIKG